MKPMLRLALVAACALHAPGVARAQNSYKIQVIFKTGDTVGDVVTRKSRGDIEIGTLNDRGQIVFLAENTAGGEVLIQYADGKLTPLAAAGKEGPSGIWPATAVFTSPVSMNHLGNVVFSAGRLDGTNLTVDTTYLWDFQAQKLATVVTKGMPAVNDLTFEQGGGFVPAINSTGDIAFAATIKNAAGKEQQGIFFLGRDGKMLPVALPDQELPGGGKIEFALHFTLNEAGTIAFLAQPQGKQVWSAYLWEQGTITPVALAGADAPGGGKLGSVGGVWVNNKDRSVLLATWPQSSRGASLYRFAEGKLTSLVAPGQEMPGGGQFRNLSIPDGAPSLYGVSPANQAGAHAFVARLSDGSRAAYLLEPGADETGSAKLSLILKTGAATDLGTITNIGNVNSDPPTTGVGLNGSGQVALPARFADGTVALILLTTAP